MADEITLIGSPQKFSQPDAASALEMPLDQSIEVAGYDILDLQPGVLAINLDSGDVTVQIPTSMQKDRKDGWIVAGSKNVTTTGWDETFTVPASGKVLLRYVRWRIVFTGGASATVTLTLKGMARRLGA